MSIVTVNARLDERIAVEMRATGKSRREVAQSLLATAALDIHMAQSTSERNRLTHAMDILRAIVDGLEERAAK